MAFRQDRRLPNGWSFEEACERLQEFQREIEETESLDVVLLFVDGEDLEHDLTFLVEHLGDQYSKTIIIVPDNGTGNPGLIFFGDTEFDVDEIMKRLFQHHLTRTSH